MAFEPIGQRLAKDQQELIQNHKLFEVVHCLGWFTKTAAVLLLLDRI